MRAIDQILKASQQRVAESGMLSQQIRMGVVSAVGTDGTITVAVDVSTFPKVRLLQSVQTPVVGDRVEIANTLGGWVCVGALRGNNAPRIQSGTVTVTNTTASQWSNPVTVTFPLPFSTTPQVIATVNSGSPGSGGTAVLYWAIDTVTTTGFVIRQFRSNLAATGYGWIATTY